MNQVVLVAKIYELYNNELVVAYKDMSTYEQNYITFDITHEQYTQLRAYTKVDDIIGIKGQVLNNNRLRADKMTFLTSSKGGEESDSDSI